MQGFDGNTSLTDISVPGLDERDKKLIEYYTTRNKVPTLRNPQTAMIVVTGISPALSKYCPKPEAGLTVVYETFLNRGAGDWNSEYGTQNH